MAKIIAKFSNGHADEYKGARPVAAAWMIVSPTGQIKSGHSLDIGKARKTAQGNLPTLGGAPDCIRKMPRAPTVPALQYFQKLARQYGFNSHKEAYAAGQAELAKFRSACKIEIIALQTEG